MNALKQRQRAESGKFERRYDSQEVSGTDAEREPYSRKTLPGT